MEVSHVYLIVFSSLPIIFQYEQWPSTHPVIIQNKLRDMKLLGYLIEILNQQPQQPQTTDNLASLALSVLASMCTLNGRNTITMES